MNLELARTNMVKQQIQPLGVINPQVLSVMATLPRQDFVPAEYADLAYTDTHIPLAHGQAMLAPKEEAWILQALNIQKCDKVLEIGTGSGYLTALIASLSDHVFSIDIFEDFVLSAKSQLEQQGLGHVNVACADAINGWPEQVPYDAVIVSGAVKTVPEQIKESVAIGGRLFAIIGEAPLMSACMMTRVDRQHFQTEVLFETVTPPLINKTTEVDFVF